MPEVSEQQRLKLVTKILASVAFFLLLGCAPSTSEVVKDWQDKGWSLVDVQGSEGPVERYAKLMSKKAQAVEASWIEVHSSQRPLLLRKYPVLQESHFSAPFVALTVMPP